MNYYRQRKRRKLDPLGSLVNADVGASYQWMNQAAINRVRTVFLSSLISRPRSGPFWCPVATSRYRVELGSLDLRDPEPLTRRWIIKRYPYRQDGATNSQNGKM